MPASIKGTHIKEDDSREKNWENIPWIKEGNWYINDSVPKKGITLGESASSGKQVPVISTPTVKATQASSAMDFVTTTTSSITSSIMQTGQGMIQTVTTVMAVTTSMVTNRMGGDPIQAMSNMSNMDEGKRKQDKNMETVTSQKRRVISPEKSDSTPVELVHLLLHEMAGLKSSMDEVKTVVSSIEEVKTTVNMIQEETREWNKKYEWLEGNLSAVKDLVEMAHNLINDEVQDWKNALDALHSAITEQGQEMSNNLQIVKGHSSEIKSLKDSMKTMHGQIDKVAEDQRASVLPLQQLQQDITETVGITEYPIKCTIVAQCVWYRENEDLEKVASVIIHKGLGLSDVKIVRVVRKSGKDSGQGLVKIEVSSEEELKQILRNKSKLKKSMTKELQEVYIRQSKREEMLVMERNEDTILQELGVRDDYVRLSSGHFVSKRHMPRRPNPGKPYFGWGGRGGYRGHGDRTALYSRGPVVGRENNRDLKVVQQLCRRERDGSIEQEMNNANADPEQETPIKELMK